MRVTPQSNPIVGIGLVMALVVLGLFIALVSPLGFMDRGTGAPGHGTAGAQTAESGRGKTPTPVAPALSLGITSTAKIMPITASGVGFQPNEAITLWVVPGDNSPPTALVTSWADGKGQFGKLSFGLPSNLKPGPYTIKVVGELSGRTATADLTLVDQQAWLDLGQSAGKPGAPLFLKGGGFQPGEKVQVFLDAQPRTDLGTLSADTQGLIQSYALKVPTATEGDVSIVAQGTQSGLQVGRQFHVVGYHPWAILNSYTLRVSEAVNLAVFDLVPGEEVQVSIDGTAIQTQTSLKADPQGQLRFDHLFTAKPTDAGKHEVSIVGNISQSKMSLTFEVVTYRPSMQLSVYAGRPGSQISLTGQGFAPTETVHIYLGDGSQRREVSTVTAGKNGDFYNTGTFEFPVDGPTGLVTITMQGDQSGASVSQRLGVADLQPSANLSPSSGTAGTIIRINVGGFAAAEIVDVYLATDTSTKLASATTNGEGAVQGVGPLTIPSTTDQTVVYLLRGEKSHAEVKATFTIVTGTGG